MNVPSTKIVDNIELRSAMEVPVWQIMYALDPERLIDVRMTYNELHMIYDLLKEKGYIHE